MDPGEDVNNDPARALLRQRGYRFCDDRDNVVIPAHQAGALRSQEEAKHLENLIQEGVNTSSTDHVTQNISESAKSHELCLGFLRECCHCHPMCWTVVNVLYICI